MFSSVMTAFRIWNKIFESQDVVNDTVYCFLADGFLSSQEKKKKGQWQIGNRTIEQNDLRVIYSQVDFPVPVKHTKASGNLRSSQTGSQNQADGDHHFDNSSILCQISRGCLCLFQCVAFFHARELWLNGFGGESVFCVFLLQHIKLSVLPVDSHTVVDLHRLQDYLCLISCLLWRIRRMRKHRNNYGFRFPCQAPSVCRAWYLIPLLRSKLCSFAYFWTLF